MTQADRVYSTPPTNTPINPTRRRFLTVAAGASVASVGTLAAAAMPAPQVCPIADDSALLKLEEQILEQHRLATAYDDEIIRLSKIWTAESKRLYAASLREGSPLTTQEQWNIVTALPESIEHNRLCRLQDPFMRKMDALIREMWALPAHTADGRRAKVTVLLVCILGQEWTQVGEIDYPEQMARDMLIELVGGEPGKMLREQFGPPLTTAGI